MNQSYKINFFNFSISILTFFMLPLSIPTLISFTNNLTISYALIFSLQALIIITINYKMIEVHFKRFLKNKENIIFILFGIVLFTSVLLLNMNLIKGYLPSIDFFTLKRFFLFSPFIVISFTIFFPISYCVTYKILTDKIEIANIEILIIFLTSLVFGALVSLTYVPFSVDGFLRSFLFYSFISGVLSYLYNQTNSLTTSYISFAIVLLIKEIIIHFI